MVDSLTTLSVSVAVNLAVTHPRGMMYIQFVHMTDGAVFHVVHTWLCWLFIICP